MAKLGEYGDKLEGMTAQEVFDVAAEHLLKQGKKSLKAEAGCVYDGGDVCCAAAPFIKDYDSSMEGQPWFSLVEEGLVGSSHDDLIESLQTIHDQSPPNEWAYNLTNLANREGLSASKVEEFENVRLE